MEARMTGKVKSRKIGSGGIAFGSGSVSFFSFALLLYCALLLVGCNSPETNVAGVNQVQPMRPEAKKAHLLKLLDRKFENPEAHFELGQLYHAEGSWPKAEYRYNIALSFDPAHAEAQAAMVKLFLDNGDTAKAKTYADTYINQVAGSEIQSLRLAMAFQKQQHDEYTLACYQQAINLSPNSARINKQFGYYYLGKNDNVRAKEYLVHSFQVDPRQPDVAGELGRLGVEVRIPQKAERSTAKLGSTVGQSGQESKTEWKIVMKHGLFQVEPVGQKSDKK
jgi:Tfp pilus assembly protein PilF